jgi:mannosyltransferase
VRFATLPARSFWVDEAHTALATKLDFAAMLHQWLLHEETPPLYFTLAWLWTGALGHDEAGLRSLSALAGTATIPVAYAVGHRLGGRRVGLVAALLTAVNPLAVWFSQDGRAYALLVLFAGLSFLAFLRALDRPARGRLATWAGASALTVACHYFAVFLVAAEAVWLCVVHGERRRALAAAAVVPAGTFLALLPIALNQRGHTSLFIRASSLPSRLVQIPAQYVVGLQPPAQVLVSVLAALALPLAGFLLVARADARERRSAALAGFVGGAALLGPVALALVPGLDYLLTRHTVAAFVPLVSVVAIALGGRRAGWVGAGALIWLCAFSLMIDVVTANASKFNHEDWRTAADAIGRVGGPRALVLTPAQGRGVLSFYIPRAQPPKRSVLAVREIAVIGLPPRLRRVGQSPRPPRPPAPVPPPGFVLAERREAPTFTLLRYRAGRDVKVTQQALRSLALTRSERVALLVQTSALLRRQPRADVRGGDRARLRTSVDSNLQLVASTGLPAQPSSPRRGLLGGKPAGEVQPPPEAFDLPETRRAKEVLVTGGGRGD